MIGTWPATRPGDKTLGQLFVERPELLDVDAVAVHVREGWRSS